MKRKIVRRGQSVHLSGSSRRSKHAHLTPDAHIATDPMAGAEERAVVETAPPPSAPVKAKDPTASLTFVGPHPWREPLARWLEYEPGLVLVTEIDPENRPKHLFDLPTSDVAIALADTGDPDPVVELSPELQSKNRGPASSSSSPG